MHKLGKTFFTIAFVLVLVASCVEKDPKTTEKSMLVTVTAYNSVPWQTTSTDSDIAAWGDTLKPGMKSIAVSRDLLHLGLVRGSVVEIEGLEGSYLVLDKMNRRYQKRIDIYMGLDVQAARDWGKQKRTITWSVEKESKYDKRYQYIPPDSLS